MPILKKCLLATLLMTVGLGQAIANDTLKARLEKALPDRKVVSVTQTPSKGLYEVLLDGKQIVYSDAQGEYVLVGELIDVASRKNLTEARNRELNVVNFSSLPLDNAIKEVRGNGARKLAIFSDPDCPYCKQLEKEGLKGVTDVTIYTFLVPLSIHPDAKRKSQLIWCAADRPKAWKQWMLSGKLANNAGNCANPVTANIELAGKLGITGTPTLIFENGQLVAGALPKDALVEYLALANREAQ